MDKSGRKKAAKDTPLPNPNDEPKMKPSSSGAGPGETPTSKATKNGRSAATPKVPVTIAIVDKKLDEHVEGADRDHNDLRRKHWKTKAYIAKEFAERDRRALVKQMEDVEKRQKSRQVQAAKIDKANAGFGTVALQQIKNAVSTAIKHINDGLDELEQLKKEQKEDIELLRNLREELVSMERNHALDQIDNKYEDRDSGLQAKEDPVSELKKFQENGMYLPKLPAGFADDWKDLTEWIKVVKNFLPIVRNHMCSPEDWPADLGVWRNADRNAPDTQKMLEKYLIKYINDHREEIIAVGGATTDELDDFIKAIRDVGSRNKTISEHYKQRSFEKRSYYRNVYVAILKHMDAQRMKTESLAEGINRTGEVETDVDSVLDIEWSLENILDMILRNMSCHFDLLERDAEMASRMRRAKQWPIQMSHDVQETHSAGPSRNPAVGAGQAAEIRVGSCLKELASTRARTRLNRTESLSDIGQEMSTGSAVSSANATTSHQSDTTPVATPERAEKPFGRLLPGKGATDVKAKPNVR